MGVGGPAGAVFEFGDQPHQVVPGQQPGADQQNRCSAVEQRRPKRRHRALNEALQVDPVAAAVLSGIGLQHHSPVHACGLGLVAQRGQQQRVEVDPLQAGRRGNGPAKAVQQLGLGAARDARRHREHQHAALAEPAQQAVFDHCGLRLVVVVGRMGRE